MRIASLKVVLLRAVVRELNKAGIRNGEIAARAGMLVEPIAPGQVRHPAVASRSRAASRRLPPPPSRRFGLNQRRR